MDNNEKKKCSKKGMKRALWLLGGFAIGYVCFDDKARNATVSAVKNIGGKITGLFSGSTPEVEGEAVGTTTATTAPQQNNNQSGYQRPYYGGHRTSWNRGDNDYKKPEQVQQQTNNVNK